MGDSGIPCLVALSVNDSKPVHYNISMLPTTIKWIEVKKKVSNIKTLLRINTITSAEVCAQT